MLGVRYNKIIRKHQREIVLLKSFPCRYGKCSFCNYIEDNSTDEKEIDSINLEVLKEITGEFGVLEVINSGSVFELTPNTMAEIKKIVKEKNIKILYFEIYYGYIKRLEEIRKYFDGIEIRFRMGMETFDDDFRINIYNKNFHTDENILNLLGKELYSVCLLVCTKGQTKEMIDHDMQMLKTHFELGTVNVFTNNSTDVTRDQELVDWFMKKYAALLDDPSVEVLYEKTDFGVGD